MSAKQIKLSERLGTIAGFIEKGSAVADIGTDHGFLPVYLAQRGLAHPIIASDISSESLKAALGSAVKYGVADRISFITAPGLAGINEAEVDTIVLSGMGGETISQILAQAPWTKQHGTRLILQPQTKIGKLCSWLRGNGYDLCDAALACEKGRLYTVMLARAPAAHEFGIRNSKCEISDSCVPEVELLSVLAANGTPLFPEYIDGLISTAKRAVEGMAGSGAAGYANMAKRLEDLKMFK